MKKNYTKLYHAIIHTCIPDSEMLKCKNKSYNWYFIVTNKVGSYLYFYLTYRSKNNPIGVLKLYKNIL